MAVNLELGEATFDGDLVAAFADDPFNAGHLVSGGYIQAIRELRAAAKNGRDLQPVGYTVSADGGDGTFSISFTANYPQPDPTSAAADSTESQPSSEADTPTSTSTDTSSTDSGSSQPESAADPTVPPSEPTSPPDGGPDSNTPSDSTEPPAAA